MKQHYIVQYIEGFDGIEFMADSPVGRHIYRAGEVVELDDAVHNVAGLLGRGQIALAPPEAIVAEPASESVTEEAASAPRNRGKSAPG